MDNTPVVLFCSVLLPLRLIWSPFSSPFGQEFAFSGICFLSADHGTPFVYLFALPLRSAFSLGPWNPRAESIQVRIAGLPILEANRHIILANDSERLLLTFLLWVVGTVHKITAFAHLAACPPDLYRTRDVHKHILIHISRNVSKFSSKILEPKISVEFSMPLCGCR